MSDIVISFRSDGVSAVRHSFSDIAADSRSLTARVKADSQEMAATSPGARSVLGSLGKFDYTPEKKERFFGGDVASAQRGQMTTMMKGFSAGAREAGASLSYMGDRGEEGFGRIDHASFRVQQRMGMVALSVAGINSPVNTVVSRFEYLQFMADRFGTTIPAMLIKFAPVMGISAGIGLIGMELKGMADDGKKTFEEVGMGSGGFIRNLEVGAGWLNVWHHKLESMDDVLLRIDQDFEKFTLKQSRRAEDALHPALGKVVAERNIDDLMALKKATEAQMTGAEKRLQSLKANVNNLGVMDNSLQMEYTRATGGDMKKEQIWDDTAKERLAKKYDDQILANRANLAKRIQDVELQIEMETGRKITDIKKEDADQRIMQEQIRPMAERIFRAEQGVMGKWNELSEGGPKFSKMDESGSAEAYRNTLSQTFGDEQRNQTRAMSEDIRKSARSLEQILRELTHAHIIPTASLGVS